MKKTAFYLLAAATMAVAAPAFAEEATPELKVSGTVGLVSDYRFRGVSQTDKGMAIQGGVTVAHKSGAYVGFWGSNLGGWGRFTGANMELDLIAGYAKPIGPVTVDAGLTWYMYPAGADLTDFAEPYVKVSGSAGPVSLLAGVAYAPKQKALGNFSATSYSNGQSQDNLYIWGDSSYVVPGVDVKLKGHLGYSKGNPGLGPNGTSVAPTGSYIDYSVGAERTFGPLTFGVSYVGTDITKAKSAYLRPNFAVQDRAKRMGESIASGTVLFSMTAAF